MKLKYLGTAASEGFPAVFCNCEYCKKARALGGKNIRTRSQALINDDLLIDLPADSFSHFLNNGIEGDSIKYLLITHAHSDHFYEKDLNLRHSCYAHCMRAPELELYCSATTASRLSAEPKNVKVTTVKAFEPFRAGEYTVTPLPARHMPGGEALIYIISGEKTILYAHDTGYFYDEVFEYIKANNIRFDMVSMDCTNVDIPISDSGTHMGFDNINRVLSVLKDIGAVDGNTVKYVNHFSHNGNPLHEHLCQRAAEYGFLVSYDGCTVEF